MPPVRRAAPAAAALAVLMLLGGCAGAGEGLPLGMRVDQLQPNRWTLSTGRLDFDEANLQIRAYYRAAVLAKAAGFGWFQVVDYDEGPLGIGAGMKFQIVGVNDPKAPIECLAQSEFTYMCVVRNVEETFAQYGPMLGKTREQIDAEVRFQSVPLGGKQ